MRSMIEAQTQSIHGPEAISRHLCLFVACLLSGRSALWHSMSLEGLHHPVLAVIIQSPIDNYAGSALRFSARSCHLA